MTSNTKGVRFQLKSGAPMQDLTFGHGAQKRRNVIASNGELNANDKKDLTMQIAHLLANAASGNIVVASQQTPREVAEERVAVLAAAWNDPEAMQELGITMAAQLNEANARQGFVRQLCVEESLSQGNTPRHRVRYPNVVAVLATGPADVLPQIVRDRYVYPAEISMVANLEIENREIAQATGDILDEKYREGLEAIMVAEDRLWKTAADATVGLANPLTSVSGTLTPTYLSGIITQVTNWNIPVTKLLMANDLWNDIRSDDEFLAAFDPLSQNEILLTGKLGQIYGAELLTDGFRPPEQRVLENGELYAVGQDHLHGAITSREGVVPTPINGAIRSRATKGWFMEELFSLSITNARSVAKAIR